MRVKTFDVRMLQGWRESLMKECRLIGEIEGAGYAEGSTVWRVAVSTKKFKTPEQLSDYLREKLNVAGWLSVDLFDWTETEREY